MTILANNPSTGLGTLSAIPAATINGTALGTPPAGTIGVRFYLPSGASVTFTIASAQPGSPPAITFTLLQTSTGPNWDEPLCDGQMIYVTATSGGALFRWI
jgi:hypothetical protein